MSKYLPVALVLVGSIACLLAYMGFGTMGLILTGAIILALILFFYLKGK